MYRLLYETDCRIFFETDSVEYEINHRFQLSQLSQLSLVVRQVLRQKNLVPIFDRKKPVPHVETAGGISRPRRWWDEADGDLREND